ncbi:MAG: hypothetical protein ACI4JG_00300 [Acutalibacteraceae bacterium]
MKARTKLTRMWSFLLALVMVAGLAMPATVYAEESTLTYITSIAVTIAAPELGKTPDFNPVYVSTPENGVALNETVWFKIAAADFTGSDEDEWLEMESDEAFATGYYYSVDLNFNTKNNYRTTATTTGTLNGMPHNDTYGDICGGNNSSRFAYISGVFEPLTESDETVITDIAATITAPELGKTPDYNPVYVSTPENAVELDEILWYKIAAANFTGTGEDSWDEMESDEAFTTGYYYSPEMFFNPKDGFKLTVSTTGTVNGTPHDNTYGDVFDGDLAYLCTVFEPLHEHTHSLTLVPAKDATATEPGNIAYYTCDGCDLWFADENGETEITDKDSVIIPALGEPAEPEEECGCPFFRWLKAFVESCCKWLKETPVSIVHWFEGVFGNIKSILS